MEAAINKVVTKEVTQNLKWICIRCGTLHTGKYGGDCPKCGCQYSCKIQ